MNKFTYLNQNEQKIYFEQVGAIMGLNSTYVEKDFWVCWVLNVLFTHPELKNNLTFKGGTSLSKVYGVIQRFSEDIDLTISREFLGFSGESSPENAASRNKMKAALINLRKACQQYVSGQLFDLLQDGFKKLLPESSKWSLEIDESDVDRQTLLFSYPSCWAELQSNYVKPIVRLEFGARSDPWPASQHVVKSFVAERYPQIFEQINVPVLAIAVERTFWEKVMLIHEESFRPEGKQRALRMARHYYDIWSLMKHGVDAIALSDEELYESVKKHREIFFNINWVDYSTLNKGSLRLMPHEQHLEWWKRDYEDMKEMFLGKPPSFDELLASIARLESQLNKS